MKTHYIFHTYNELNKEFEVHVMLVKDQYQFKLVKRLDGNKPPRITLADIVARLDKIDQRIDKLEQIIVQDHNLLIETSQLLHKIIKLNNLKTE